MIPNASKSGTVSVGDLTVNRLGFGAMRTIGADMWGEPPDRERSLAVLRRTVELGVNFIDTADAYGPNVSEELIREALHPYRDASGGKVVIASKGGLSRPGPTDWVANNGSPEGLRQALEGSLKRLDIQTIDLYQLHSPDRSVAFEDSVKALDSFKREGLIANIGLSNISLTQLEQARGITVIASVQNAYNVGMTGDDPVVDYCTRQGIAYIPYFPLGGGQSSLDALKTVADKHGATPHQIALAWLLARSPVMLPIPGTSSLQHLDENVAAAGISLDTDDMTALAV